MRRNEVAVHWKNVYWIKKIGVSRGATLSCCQLNTIRNWINYFIDSKQKHNNKMYSLNYVYFLLNNIWEWHPATIKFVGSTNFLFQCSCSSETSFFGGTWRWAKFIDNHSTDLHEIWHTFTSYHNSIGE